MSDQSFIYHPHISGAYYLACVIVYRMHDTATATDRDFHSIIAVIIYDPPSPYHGLNFPQRIE